MLNKTTLYNTGWFLLSVLFLIYPALYNGYPLVYSDSGTYIASGFDNQVPVDRPIMYAFFIRHISMAFSLWLVIIMQAILVTAVLLFVVRHFFRQSDYFLYTFLIIVLLSLTTGISYYTSQLMPDIFSGLVILAIGLLLTGEQLSAFIKTMLALIIVFSGMAHSSNLLTSTLITGMVILPALIFRRRRAFKTRSILFVAAIVASGWILTPLLNASLGAGFKVSRAPNIFIMGRLIESGVLNEYLHENCGKKDIPLCKYMDRLPAESWHFLWLPDSPLYDGGCRDSAGHHSSCWLQKNEEYKPVIADIFTDFKYIRMYSAYAFKQTFLQLADFKNEGLSPMMEGSPVMGMVQWHFKNESDQYIHAKQAHEEVRADLTSAIQNIVIFICALFLAACFAVKRFRIKIPAPLRMLTFIVLSGLIFNACVCVSFSMIASRFQGRVIWLMLFVSVLIAYYQLNAQKKRQ